MQSQRDVKLVIFRKIFFLATLRAFYQLSVVHTHVRTDRHDSRLHAQLASLVWRQLNSKSEEPVNHSLKVV